MKKSSEPDFLLTTFERPIDVHVLGKMPEAVSGAVDLMLSLAASR